MSDIHVRMFVVPASDLGELHELEKQADEADAQNRRDRYYLSNQVFGRAEQVAVASVVLKQEEYEDPAVTLWAWIKRRFRGGKGNMVVDADEFEAIRSGLSAPRADDLIQWADAHIDGIGECDRSVLVEIFDAVVAMVRSVPPGPHGLVYGYFFADELEPPAPEPEPEPRRPISEQDKKWLNESWDRHMRRMSARAYADYWPEEENTEGRYILGLLPPGRAALLRSACLTAWRVVFEQGRAEGHALLGELSQQLEHELIELDVVTRAGAVRAHTWLSLKTGWDDGKLRGGVATPEMAHDLWQRLDALEAKHGGAEGVIEDVWTTESHWSRDEVREAYAKVRDLVRRAMDRGQGFAWLLDRDW